MKLFISQYIPIAHLIAQTIGEDCEVVLHDLEDPEHSVVYTVNNKVTGRAIGQSFNQLIPEAMLSKNLKNGLVTNYYYHTPQGIIIKSSTALIKDFDGVVVGAICVNINATKIKNHLDWISSMLPGFDETHMNEK
ncbi:MAG: PAS domain-containing protein, partial [Angelakisella sp.]